MPRYVEYELRSKEFPGYQGKYMTRWTNETRCSGAFSKLGLLWIGSHTDFGKEVRTIFHNSKRDYFCGLIGSKPRQSTLWQALKSALPRPTQNWSCFSEDAKELAKKFNHYFATTASSVPSTPMSTNKSSINPTLSPPDADSLNLLTIDTDECHSRLSAIKPTRVLALMVYQLVF